MTTYQILLITIYTFGLSPAHTTKGRQTLDIYHSKTTFLTPWSSNKIYQQKPQPRYFVEFHNKTFPIKYIWEKIELNSRL